MEARNQGLNQPGYRYSGENFDQSQDISPGGASQNFPEQLKIRHIKSLRSSPPNQGAEPFVTLFLQKSTDPRSSRNLAFTPALTIGGPRDSNTYDCRSMGTNVSKPERVSGSDRTPNRTREMSVPTNNSISSPLEKKIITLKYRTPSTIKVAVHDEIADTTTSPEFLLDSSQRSDPDVSSLSKRDRRQRSDSTTSLTDPGARSSKRVRKLTTKAQALAGSKYLPSFQSMSDNESAQSHIGDAPRTPSMTGEVPGMIQDMAKSQSLENVIDDTPVESVEPSLVRISSRDRKPTVRAIESETSRSPRKRPTSPTTSERAAKIAKSSPSMSARPSRLRHVIASTEHFTTTDDDDRLPDKSSSNLTAAAMSESQAVRRSQKMGRNMALHDADHYQNDSKMSRGESKSVVADKSVTVDQRKKSTKANGHQEINTASPRVSNPDSRAVHGIPVDKNSVTQNSAGKDKSGACDLMCLPPSSRLYMFAKLASELPDSEDDDSSSEADIDLDTAAASCSEGTKSLLEMAGQMYCRCHDNGEIPKSMKEVDELLPQSPPPSDRTRNCARSKLPSRNAHVEATGSQSSLPAGAEQKASRRGRPSRGSLARRSKTRHPRLAVQHQSSSYEQRMQADYRGPKRGRRARRAPQLTRSTYATANSEQTGDTITINTTQVTKANTQAGFGASAAACRDGDTALEGTMQRPDIKKYLNQDRVHEDKISRFNTARISSHDNALQGNDPAEQLHLDDSVKQASREGSNKLHHSASKKGTRGQGKTSAGGSVRLSLQNKSGHILKPYQNVATPPPPKSIKLRFTRAAQ